jgi:hypothetical protein
MTGFPELIFILIAANDEIDIPMAAEAVSKTFNSFKTFPLLS